MQPRKHLLATCSVLLIAALLAACAAPAAAPTATPVPPMATPGPLDVAMAYESAWNTFDANAVGALLAESFSATYDGYPASDPAAWLEEFPYGMARGSHMRIKLRDCQVSGDSVTCTVGSISDCFQMDAIETLTVKDGKITQLQHQTPPEEGAKSGAYFTGLIKWAESQDIPEARAYLSERAKGVDGYDWGVAYEAACKKYEAAKAQANDSTAVVQAWLDAINAGDLDAAMALMTPDAVIPGTGVPTRPARNVVDWWIDMESHFGAPDCQQSGDQLVCDFTMTDHGCTVASGYTVGESMRYAFNLQDGKIHRLDKVSIASVGNDVSRYYEWLEEEMAWADTHHAEELAGIDWDGFSTGGGDIVVKLCQDYADFLEKQVPVITASAQALVDAINGGDVDAALALLTDDAEVTFQGDKAAGTDQLSSLFNWLVGKETQVQIKDCVWQGDKLACTVSVVDGCMAASGAPDGLPGMMIVNALEDGTLQNVVSVLSLVERKPYEAWLEAETAWASANRADELAQAEGYSQDAGAMAVKLCQDYAAAPKLDAATASRIETLVEEIMASNQLPGLALGVVKDGELVYAKGFGVTSLEDDEPVTPQTVFQWNETSMAPTAMAVLQLVDAGNIDLDAPVTDYLPDFQMKDERYRDITAGQLLAHRSGIADSSALRANSGNAMADWENLTPEFDDAAIDRWVRSLADQELVMAPGSGFEYSDQGYALLGAVIGAASGQSYEAYMDENILGPLGMDNSTFLLEEVDEAMLAAPHVTKEGNLVVSTAMPYHRPFAAANNLYASIEDMAKLVEVSLDRGALDDQRILPESAVDQMWEANGQTPFADFPFGVVHPSNMMIDWGYGWFLGDIAGHRVASTVGGDYGYNGSVAVAPDANLGVIVVGNRDLLPEGYFANDTVTDVMAMLLDGMKPEPAAVLDDATVAEIETMVQEMMAENEIPGYALGIVKDGDIAYLQGFGVERIGEDKPVTPHTVFGTGSAGKTATVAAIMQLAAEGKVDLDAPVTGYLPYFKLADARYKDITLRQMATHRSGLPDAPADWFPLPVEYDDGALERYVRSMEDMELLFAPGTQWAYSSLGMIVLADVIAEVSGQSFEDYLQENIIDPLGMSDTLLVVREEDQAKVAGNHVRNEQGQVVVSDIFPYRRQFAGTGPLYSSVTDLARFAAANLQRGEMEGVRILPPTAYDTMWEPVSDTVFEAGPLLTPLLATMGMSWAIGELDGHRYVSHFGYDEGYAATILLAPDDDMAVVMASNYFDDEEFNMSAWETAIDALRMLLAKEG